MGANQSKVYRRGQVIATVLRVIGGFLFKAIKTHIIRKHTYSQGQCNGHILFVLMRGGAKTCTGKWLFYDGKIP